jgi:hypothetical protein
VGGGRDGWWSSKAGASHSVRHALACRRKQNYGVAAGVWLPSVDAPPPGPERKRGARFPLRSLGCESCGQGCPDAHLRRARRGAVSRR